MCRTATQVQQNQRHQQNKKVAAPPSRREASQTSEGLYSISKKRESSTADFPSHVYTVGACTCVCTYLIQALALAGVLVLGLREGRAWSVRLDWKPRNQRSNTPRNSAIDFSGRKRRPHMKCPCHDASYVPPCVVRWFVNPRSKLYVISGRFFAMAARYHYHSTQRSGHPAKCASRGFEQHAFFDIRKSISKERRAPCP